MYYAVGDLEHWAIISRLFFLIGVSTSLFYLVYDIHEMCYCFHQLYLSSFFLNGLVLFRHPENGTHYFL